MKTLRYIILGALAVLATACVQDPDAPMNQPDLPTMSVDESSVTRVSMVVNGIFSKDMTDITEYGVEISETLFEAGGTYKTLVPQEIGADGFSLGVTGLTLNQTYFLRAFIGNGYSKLYSSTITQKTPESSVASISDVTIVDNQYFVATIEDNGGRNLEDVGFVWGEVNDRKSIRREKRYPGTLGADGKTITLPMSDIGKGTYYVLAYAEDDKDGTGFSRIPFELVLRDDVPPVKPDEPVVNKYLTFTSEGTTKISLITSGGRSPVVYYSYNADTWTKWDYSELEFSADNPLYICGDNPDGFSSSKGIGGSFKTSGDYYAVQGDIMSLLNYSKDMSTVPAGCFYALFCESVELKIAPELPATTLGDECYGGIFAGCSALIEAPALPATTLSYACYLKMFERCTGLVSAPELPSDNLAEFCYEEMFCGCTSLTTAPTLPATTLAKGCYYYMFEGCSNLTSSPELKATILAEECYKEMFRNCTKLNYVKCLATDINADDCVSDWLYNVASSGTFVKSSKMNDWTRGPSGIPEGWTVENDGEETIHPSKYLTFTSEGTTKISLENYDGNAPLLYYSSDAKSWFLWNYEMLTVTKDSPIYICGENPSGFSLGYNDHSTFAASGDLFSVEGDIMSLLDKDKDMNAIPNDNCFHYLFHQCSLLLSAPSLPATKLTENCYGNMFSYCTALISAPELPATSLAASCYSGMFYGCTSLISAPELLPAIDLYSFCYEGMFAGCSSLKTAPVLPAPRPEVYSYSGMFRSCSQLNYVKCLAAEFKSEVTTGWLEDVAPSGTFVKMASMNDWPTGSNGIPEGWIVVEDGIAASHYLTFFSEGSTLLSMQRYGGNSPILYYSYDKTNWTKWDFANLTITSDTPLYICGDNLKGLNNGGWDYSSFSASGDNFSVSGNVMSLLSKDGEVSAIPCDYCFSNLFEECSGLTSAPDLPSTILTEGCYEKMFYNCSSLTVAPDLPATILAVCCYYNMFSDCTSLTNAPALPAMKLANACYYGMFADCTSLTSPPTLPATTMADNCYDSMFIGAALKEAPELPATALSRGCYRCMFMYCDNMVSGPSTLPAMELAELCYSGMFSCCRRLSSAPILPASALATSCYTRMFEQCNDLIYVKCLAKDISADDCITEWMQGVSPIGTFVKASQMNDWPRGENGIPEGWTVVDDGSVAVTGITLDKESVSIKVGESATITPQVAPASATNKSVTWSSNHPEFASVSGGVVTGVSAGTAVITATTVDGGFTATCTVTVKNKTNSGGNEDFDFEDWD